MGERHASPPPMDNAQLCVTTPLSHVLGFAYILHEAHLAENFNNYITGRNTSSLKTNANTLVFDLSLSRGMLMH
jgi:hypothetical protein